MNSVLYIYDIENLGLIQEKIKDKQFRSIGYIFNCAKTIDELLEKKDYVNNVVIDITNLIKDSNYYRIFIENYLKVLSDECENVSFCIQSKYFYSFTEMFPYSFDEQHINYEFKYKEEKDSDLLVVHDPSKIYVYKNPNFINNLYNNGSAISLSNLVTAFNGVKIEYNYDTINRFIAENNIEYLDISSAIRTIIIRNDLILQFEILIHQITLIKVKLSLESTLVSKTFKLFPLLFGEELCIEDNINDLEPADKQADEIDIDKLKSIVDQISEKLQGHDCFKRDFKQNILKFKYLNKMGERKILSILLCGYSGIGKTEFAKIASNIMYPDQPLIKINFGNYSTQGVLNSLIGSPLGYEGSKEGGELINKIDRSKSKIILIDEFEKATPSVFNFFYELLEDGKFTDRHGIVHDLDEYIIVFTSNMTRKQYQKHIPDSLKSRFDMIYYFQKIPTKDKLSYIQNTANYLIEKLKKEFDILIEFEKIKPQLEQLSKYENLRDIKRKIEDIVFSEFSDG